MTTTEGVAGARLPAVAAGFVARALAPVDIASLAVFRALFGALLLFGGVRFLLSGWIDKLFVEPTFHFKYWGFSFVEPLGRDGMVAVYVALCVLAACLCVGLCTRAAAAGYALLFGYVQLIDVTNYLNHYWLVWLLCALLVVVPAGAAFSVDARLRPKLRRSVVPAWVVWLLRFQVGVVYVSAALAKIGGDWLLHGQPLGIWLSARDELPLLGPVLALPAAALVFSWGGFLYDLLIVPALLWSRTRALAYLAVVVFHALTRVFFEIGMFPGIMMVATTLFFAPSWPRRFARAPAPSTASTGTLPPPPRFVAALVVLYVVVQVALPLRHHAFRLFPGGGDVVWDEQGMRFGWRVMVREKSGAITYRVTDKATGQEFQVSPFRYLNWRQVNEMSGQPDLILQLAHAIRDEMRQQGRDVEVRVDALVSLNGRKPAPLIDPRVDLAQARDSPLPLPFVLPRNGGPPLPIFRSRSPR